MMSEEWSNQGPPSSAGGALLERQEKQREWLPRLRLLWSRRTALFWWSIWGLVSATLLAFLLPKSFQASTRLMPPDSQSTSSMAMLAALTARTGNGLGGIAGDLLGLKTSGALFIGILQSQTVRERLVQRFDLREVYGKKLLEDAEIKLAERASISEDRKSGIITITVTDRNALRAAALAAAYVEELDRLISQLSTSSARRERVFLEERLKSVKQDLDAASERFGQFASKNTAIDIQAQAKAMVDAAAKVQGELIAAQSELQMYKQIYTEKNVRVRAAGARIAELQRQLEKLGGAQVNEKIGSPDAADPLYPSIRELPLLGVRYSDLLRRTKIEEAVYEVLTQQYELAKVEEAKETPSVKVLDPARMPERKSFPPRLLMMLFGTVAGLAGASVWVLCQARWERTAASDPRKVFAAEVFETVKISLPWAATNGAGNENVGKRIWKRLRRTSEKQTIAK